MPLKEMPAFIKSNVNVKNSIIFCTLSCVCLFIQLILMDKNAINIVFDIIIPFSAAICFACYSITMAMDRPIILICPPTVYFVSLLLNKLILVEVGVKDTYPFITMIEMIPYAFFCVCVASGKFKKATNIVLRIFSIVLMCAGFVLAILAVFFRIIIFLNRVHYLMNTFALISGFFAIIFIYFSMMELIKIAGCQKRRRNRSEACQEAVTN